MYRMRIFILVGRERERMREKSKKERGWMDRLMDGWMDGYGD